ncbi:MAG: hypothetical protein RL758_177 [Pseudomonadota bacterium]|jgi:DNA-binding MarR family transcriptional regulator
MNTLVTLMQSERHQLENNLLAFFDRNRDEELTTADAAAKFGVRQGPAATIMKEMVERGLLKRYRSGNLTVYAAP